MEGQNNVCPNAASFKHQLSSHSRVAKTALQCPPAEYDTQGKTRSVSRMQYMEFSLDLQRILGYVYVPWKVPLRDCRVQEPGMKLLCCIAIAEL